MDEPIDSLEFVRSFSYFLSFGTKGAYVKEIMAADSNKLANLIRICGSLMQTKVYLSGARQITEKGKKLREEAELHFLRALANTETS